MAELTKAYAAALFSVAREEGNPASVAEGLETLVSLLRENPEYRELLVTPALPKTERAALAHEAFDGRLDGNLVSFLLLLTEGGHLKELEACAEEFNGMYQAWLRSATAFVRSAVPLSEEQKARLTARLQTISGKDVTLSCTVDPSLVGGLTVELDGTVYDGSLRHRMDDMKKVMDQ